MCSGIPKSRLNDCPNDSGHFLPSDSGDILVGDKCPDLCALTIDVRCDGSASVGIRLLDVSSSLIRGSSLNSDRSLRNHEETRVSRDLFQKQNVGESLKKFQSVTSKHSQLAAG